MRLKTISDNAKSFLIFFSPEKMITFVLCQVIFASCVLLNSFIGASAVEVQSRPLSHRKQDALGASERKQVLKEAKPAAVASAKSQAVDQASAAAGDQAAAKSAAAADEQVVALTAAEAQMKRRRPDRRSIDFLTGKKDRRNVAKEAAKSGGFKGKYEGVKERKKYLRFDASLC